MNTVDLKEKLMNLFKFEDKGFNSEIYQVINRKKKEVEDFIQNQFIENKVSKDLEEEILNHLIKFFSKYYNENDSINKRRYSKNKEYTKYVIPYNNEEVLFYWKNKDSYYVKSVDYLRKYTFQIENIIINFHTVFVEKESNRIKQNEFFILSNKIFDYNPDKSELNIYFEYRSLNNEEKKVYSNKNTLSQSNINKNIIKILKEKLSQNDFIKFIFEKKEGLLVIEKHLNKYTKKNRVDYFIHKNLKEFLENELDLYIKNEFLNFSELQDLQENDSFDKLKFQFDKTKIFKSIQLRTINFLVQIENIQKTLWEKKKFIFNTYYVITLDKIQEYAGEEFLKSIIDEILKNKEQLEEWEELFGIKVKTKEDLLSKNTLLEKEWKKLPIDTKYFSEDFKWRLLIALTQNNDLDDILDGVLINSENWQSLNLLLNKYKEKIKTIYIDPPFNSKTTEILYKNDYKHSSWLCLMENRLSLSSQFLNDSGVYVISVDENEQERLGLLIDLIFGDYQKTMITIIHNPSGIQGENFSYTNEFAYFIFPNKKRIIYPEERSDETADVRQFMNTAKGDTINYLRESGPNCFYPILVKNGQIIGFGEPLPLDIHPSSSNILREDGIIEIYPIDDKGVERKWVFSRQSVEKIRNELFVRYDEKREKYIVMRSKKLINYKTVWTDGKYSAKKYGTLLIKQMRLGNFDFPKSVWTVYDIIKASAKLEIDSIILDFFAGSGTTAHAVMKLNEEDGGKRKFILVEMADYFYTVIIPRIKKVAYTFNWKEGKPQDMDGIGVFFKYHTLEQYEDSLENIEIDKNYQQLPKSTCFIKYIFKQNTNNISLGIEKITDPFNCKINIYKDQSTEQTDIDLIETFNYLLGIKVNKYNSFEKNGRRYILVFGEKDNQKVLIIWRNTNDIDFQEDKKIIEENIKQFNPNEVYINSDYMIDNCKSIELSLKSLMFEK